MVYTTWKFERYARTGDSVWSSTAVDITDAYDPVVRMAIGEGRDTFEFKLQNFNGEWSNGWVIGDKLKIYYKVNSSSIESSDLLLQGIVVDIPFDVTGKQDFLRIKGNNYTETLMNALVFYDPGNSGQPIPGFLEGAINSIGLFNDDFKITWNASNPSVKSTGDAFPTIYDKWFYKSALKLLENYSNNSETDDGNYYWYINESNELVWRRKTDSANFTFNTAINDYKGLKIKKDTKGIVNFIIAKGGIDPSGDAITVKRDDPVSRAKHGFKYKLITLSATAENDLIQQDKKALGNNTPISPSNYPSTTGWVATATLDSGPTMTPGSTVTVSSWTEYINAYRTEIKYRLGKQSKEYMDAHKYGKLQVELEFANGKGWGLGDVVQVTIPEIDADSKPMRVADIEYTMNSERYVLEEDEGTI